MSGSDKRRWVQALMEMAGDGSQTAAKGDAYRKYFNTAASAAGALLQKLLREDAAFAAAVRAAAGE